MSDYWTRDVNVLVGARISEWVESHEFCVVHVWAPWVSYDKEAAFNFATAEAQSRAKNAAFPLAAALFDAPENWDFMREGRLTTVPTFLIYRRGIEVCRVEGLATVEQYLNALYESRTLKE